jgi:hypothetical protein
MIFALPHRTLVVGSAWRCPRHLLITTATHDGRTMTTAYEMAACRRGKR